MEVLYKSTTFTFIEIYDSSYLLSTFVDGPLHYRALSICHTYVYRGEKHVIEWKTSKRRKSRIQETFDNPLQLVAYLGAYNVQPSTSLQVVEIVHRLHCAVLFMLV